MLLYTLSMGLDPINLVKSQAPKLLFRY